MCALPAGRVTLLFAEIESGDCLLGQFGARSTEVVAEYRRLLRVTIFKHGGHEVEAQGGRFCIAFSSARAALSATVEAMRVLRRHRWPAGISLPVRMGLHAYEPFSGTSDHSGMVIEEVEHVCAAGHRGQILVSQAATISRKTIFPPA